MCPLFPRPLLREMSQLDVRVASAALSLLRRARDLLIRRWNWKSALLSAAVRAALFFVTNLPAGGRAALAAAGAELLFRGATSGFYGAMTEAFASASPPWVGTIAATTLVPTVSHTLEFVVHFLRGTPRLASSVVASMGFTVMSTAFNLFAMRRGLLIVGQGRRPLRSDLLQIPAVLGEFVLALVRPRSSATRD
jgi:hypothetical protein